MHTRSSPRSLAALVVSLSAAATALIGTSASPAAAAQVVTSEEVTYTFVVGEVTDTGGRLVLDVGHADAVAPVFDDGTLTVQTKDDTGLHDPGVVYRNPEDLIFQVKPSAEIAVPDLPAYNFLGDAGDPVWVLPMTQDPSLLWPGWSTEHASLNGEFASIQYEITDVQGPGEFHLFLNDAFGNPIHRANSVGNLSNTWTEQVPAHVHANWAFTAPGSYQITFQVSGDWLNAPDPATTLSITGAEGHFHSGETVTLTAVQDPPTGEDHYHWFVKPAGAADFTVISGALAGTHSFTADEAQHGAQYVVKLYDHDHAVIAESSPVTIQVDDHEEPGPASQTITAALDESQGALSISVDPGDREVVLSDLALNSAGDAYEATGELRPVRVVDTRAGEPGWNASGHSSDFSSDEGDTIDADRLGWSPQVVAQSDGQGVVPGAAVEPGTGLGDSRTLASAPAGQGQGTATLGAGLDLEAPTDTDPGTYAATVTFTAI